LNPVAVPFKYLDPDMKKCFETSRRSAVLTVDFWQSAQANAGTAS